MKTIVNTDNVMRDDFAFLVEIEEGDRAVATTDGSVTRYKQFQPGQYLIKMWRNVMGSQEFYYPCSENFAKKLIDMDADQAYEAMNRYVFA